MVAGWVMIGLVIALSAAVLVSYNRFVEQRQLVRDAWANVDTELRRRYDLIPNLVETVRAYATHERGVLEEVSRARAGALASTGRPGEQARDENHLVAALRHLFAVTESYPQLEASRNFLHLQRELINTEDRIQVARRIYNANVRNLNRRVQAAPSNVVAGLFGFREEDFFEVEPALREVPTTGLLER